jgi:hypothetical protein
VVSGSKSQQKDSVSPYNFSSIQISWLDSDAEDPMSFSLAYKWMVTLVNAISALAVALASSTYAGAALDIRIQFRVTSEEVVILGKHFLSGNILRDLNTVCQVSRSSCSVLRSVRFSGGHCPRYTVAESCL